MNCKACNDVVMTGLKTFKCFSLSITYIFNINMLLSLQVLTFPYYLCDGIDANQVCMFSAKMFLAHIAILIVHCNQFDPDLVTLRHNQGT